MKISLDSDSPTINIADQIADVLVAGFLWLLCSIPIVTIGPASAALYYTVVKVARRKRETVSKAFFHSFKSNLKQGVGITVIYLLYGILLAAFAFITGYGGAWEKSPYTVVLAGIILAAPFVFTLLYIFPIISRFEGGVLRQFQYALLMSVGHFISTIILFVLLLIVCLLIYFFPFFLAILPGLYMYAASFLIERIFRQYMAEEREKYAEEEELPWYLE